MPLKVCDSPAPWLSFSPQSGSCSSVSFTAPPPPSPPLLKKDWKKSLESFQLSKLCIFRTHSGPCLLSTLCMGQLVCPRPFQHLHTLMPLKYVSSPELWSHLSTDPFDIFICVSHEHPKFKIPQTELLNFFQEILMTLTPEYISNVPTFPPSLWLLPLLKQRASFPLNLPWPFFP